MIITSSFRRCRHSYAPFHQLVWQKSAKSISPSFFSCSFAACSFRENNVNFTSLKHTPPKLFQRKILRYDQRQYFSSMVEERDDHDEVTATSISTTGTTKIPFLLADIGEGIAEVELLQWYVSPGDTVSQFDRICEVQSDKATVEITSRFDGVIDSLNGNEVGGMISVGSPLLHIQVAGQENNVEGNSREQENTLNNVDDEANKLRIPTARASDDIGRSDSLNVEIGESSHSSFSSSGSMKIITTPAVRRLGMEHNVPLHKIKGTGPKGRILKIDVLDYIKHNDNGHNNVIAHQGGALQSLTEPTNTCTLELNSEKVPTKGEEVVPIRGHSRLMVNSMTSTLQVPHMCYSDEVDVTNLQQFRRDLKPIAEQQTDGTVKLSFLPFVIKACSLALSNYPLLNSSINVKEMTLTYHAEHNIGIAMDSPRGLVVPTIKLCQDLSILDIAIELTRLQDMALTGNLSEAELRMPTFTISNIGTIGGTYMSPVVLPPQVAIGALGRIQRLPRFIRDTDKVEAVNLMNISIGGDHRVIDGATLGRFCNAWKGYLEHPGRMMFAMK